MLDSLLTLATSDLARSGLTLSDISGQVLSPAQVRQLLGLESTPAFGGYTLPYLDLVGNPVLDAGVPFARIRTISDNPDLPRYLCAGGSGAHLYIPRQLTAALARSHTLVITEGEKKATSACLAGIPTVALAGIKMYRDLSGQLLPELKSLLMGLKDQLEAVVVLYDSDGFPMNKSGLPGDPDAAAQYQQLNGGSYTRNRQVFRASLSLAQLIRETVAGLKVGHGWCKPAVSFEAGTKGGKVRVVQHRGIDDVIQAGDLPDLMDWINAAVEKAEAGDGAGGYVALGTAGDGKAVVLWSKAQDSLIELSAQALMNPAQLGLSVGKSYLYKHYAKVNKTGEVELDTKRAAIDIASECASKGRFRTEGRVFGTGTWLDMGTGGLVVNSDSGVYTAAGAAIERISESRRSIYLANGSCPPPAYRSVSDAEYAQVIGRIERDLSSFAYASEAGPELVLGWLMLSVWLGAVQARPSIWLVAPRGSGKSTLARYIKSCLGSYAWHTDMGKESTAAGIRQMLQLSSAPCILDEMEKDSTDLGGAGTGAILSLIRSAYTAGSEVRKGTADQSGKAFRIMTSCCCVSIADPILEPADLTRIAKVYMRPLSHGGKLAKPPALLGEEEAATFFWGTIQRYNQFQSLLEAVKESWLQYAGAGDAREADTFGSLIAAAMAARDLGAEDVPAVLEMVAQHLRTQLESVREGSSEADLVLDTLLGLHVEMQHRDVDFGGTERVSRETLPLSEIIAKAAAGDREADQALAGYGLAIRARDGQDYLAIPARHPMLAKLFSGTRWSKDGAWSGGLREIDGAVCNVPVRIAGRVLKVTLVPVSALGLEVASGVDVGAGVLVKATHPAHTTLL